MILITYSFPELGGGQNFKSSEKVSLKFSP